MTEITVAALQLAFSNDIDANIANVSRLVREAATRGAQVILPPELFEGEYFCRVEDEGLFANARPTERSVCTSGCESAPESAVKAWGPLLKMRSSVA